MSKLELEAFDLDQLTPEELKEFFPNVENSNQRLKLANSLTNSVQSIPVLQALQIAKSAKFNQKIPPQAYSEDQITHLDLKSQEIFFEYWNLPASLRNTFGIVQVLRFLDYLAPSKFRDLFTYQYSVPKSSKFQEILYIQGKLLRPISNLPAGYKFDLLTVSATLWIWQGDQDEEVSLYL